MLQYPEPVFQNGERGTDDKKEVSQGRTCVSRNVLTGHPVLDIVFLLLDQ